MENFKDLPLWRQCYKIAYPSIYDENDTFEEAEIKKVYKTKDFVSNKIAYRSNYNSTSDFINSDAPVKINDSGAIKLEIDENPYQTGITTSGQMLLFTNGFLWNQVNTTYPFLVYSNGSLSMKNGDLGTENTFYKSAFVNRFVSQNYTGSDSSFYELYATSDEIKNAIRNLKFYNSEIGGNVHLTCKASELSALNTLLDSNDLYGAPSNFVFTDILTVLMLKIENLEERLSALE